MTENYNIPDQVDIKSIFLTSLDKSKKVDITDIVVGISISLGLGHSMYGSMLIGDGVGMTSINQLSPLTGEHFIEFKFKTPGAVTTREVRFIMTSLTSTYRSENSDAEVFLATFESIDSFINNGIFVSKSYNGTATKIIENILRNELKTARPIVDFEDSVGELKFAFTKCKPFEKINILKDYAYTTNQTNPINYFTFYENFDGYHFKSFSKVMSDATRRSGTTYKYSAEAYNHIEPWYIISYNSNRKNSLREKMQYGRYKTVVNAYDFFTKSFSSRTYKSSESNTNIVDTSSALTTAFERLNGLEYFIPADSSRATYLIDNIISSNPFIAALEERSYNIKINGNTEIDLGDPIRIEFADIQQANSKKHALDKDLTGKYIVTNIHHEFVWNVSYWQLKTNLKITKVVGNNNSYAERLNKNYNSNNIDIGVLRA
jgi:hypothetical protein